jgi:hypothetical protein
MSFLRGGGKLLRKEIFLERGGVIKFEWEKDENQRGMSRGEVRTSPYK